MRGKSEKVKKKVILAAVILIIIGVLIFVISKTILVPKNTSRRDGEPVPGAYNQEEELLTAEGVIGPSASSEEQSHIKTEQNIIDVEEITSDTNEPVSEEVEPVSTVVLQEALRIDEGDMGDFYSNPDFEDVIPVDIRSFSKSEIPESYDSRDVGGRRYVTEVQDQGYTYLCWAYSAIAAVESDILSHHSSLDYSAINLSEKHLAYYNMHKAAGAEDSAIDDDYRELVNADNKDGAWIFDYGTNYISMGGVTNYCISLLTAWKGPVNDEGDDSFNAVYGQSYVFEENGNAPSDAYAADYHVQEVGEILASEENRDLIKQMIMEHGCVTASVNADGKYWSGHYSNLYSNFPGGEVPTANHEIIILGWDDNYSAANFVKKPEDDGAWLCRNSWGTGSGNKGFFYLSYYDETTCDNNVAAYSVAMKGEKNWYDNNYQVCGFIDNVVSALDDSQNYVTAYTASTNPYGVMYTASSDEMLKAVGFMSLETYQQYEIKVFLNPEGEGNEDNKSNIVEFAKLREPVSSTKVSNISGGYHTYTLSDPVELNKDDRFFILVEPATMARLPYERAGDNTGTANYDEWNNLTGNVHNSYEASGLSYYISDDGIGMEAQKDKDFLLKAYTNSR